MICQKRSSDKMKIGVSFALKTWGGASVLLYSQSELPAMSRWMNTMDVRCAVDPSRICTYNKLCQIW